MADIDVAPTTAAAPETGLAIDARDVSKKFVLGSHHKSLKDRLTSSANAESGEFWALRDVSVQVERGSMLGVIGHNGSGKSTFLRTLCGIYRPTAGEIRVRGRVTALLELGAGFHPELSGRENVYMNGAVVGLDRSHMDEVMDDIVAMADIGTFIEAPVETYSSGMRARLGFAVSVQLDPEILLADEITAVGDITFKAHGARRMKELRERGVTIVQVSHNLTTLLDACDQILWLHEGRTMALGDPDDVVAEYISHSTGSGAGDHAPAPSDEPNVVNPGWLSRIDVAPEGGLAQPTVGRGLGLVVGLDLPRTVEQPSIRLRIRRANGADIGLGTAFSDLGEVLAGPATVSCRLPRLPLQNGRYQVVVELLSGSEVVSSRRVPLEVHKPAMNGPDDFVAMDATWELR